MKPSKLSFLDLLIEYLFSMFGFFAGLHLTLILLSMAGMKETSAALWFMIALIVGIAVGLLVMVGREASRNELRTAYHKALDEGREGDERRLGRLLKEYRLLLDPLSALAASLLMLIPRSFLEDGALMIVTIPFVALLMIILRLPAMILARAKWSKEHIKK